MNFKSTLFTGLLLSAGLACYAQLPKEYSLSVPPEQVVYLNDTQNGEWGMGIVIWTVHVDGVNINRESNQVVSLYRDGELIRTLSPASETEITITSVMGGSDVDDDDNGGNGSGDLIDPTINNKVQFNFARENEDPNKENVPDPDFLISGTYHIVVPAGIFIVPGEDDDYINLPAAEYTYEYKNEVISEFPFVLTPVAESVVSDLKTISVAFPDAKNSSTLDYESNGGATLMYVPNGDIEAVAEKIPGGTYPDVDRKTKSFIYKYGKDTIEWADGTYTFTIKPNYLTIDNVMYSEPITVVYYIGKVDTAVKVIEGLQAEEYYTVCNLNGITVASGNANILNGLPAGLYIINGKKVCVK